MAKHPRELVQVRQDCIVDGDDAAPGAARLRQLARTEATNAAVVDRAVLAARATSSVLGGLGPEETRRHLAAVIGVVAGAFADERALSDQELRVIASLGADRAHQRVPLAAVITGFQTARNELLRALVQSARRTGIDSTVLVDGLIELDSLLIDVERQLVQAHVGTEAELRRTNRDLEAGAVREILLGVPSVPGQLARAGIDPARRYHCLVTDAADPAVIELVEHLLRSAGGAHTAELDGHLAAVVERLPSVADLTGSAGARAVLFVATPAAAIGRLAPLYRLALRARDSARARDLGGLRSLEDMALDTAGAALADLGNVLGEALSGILDPSRAYHRELAMTALAHLENGGSVEESAALLHLHPNTVKYRLGRLAEIDPSFPRSISAGLSLPQRFSWWLKLSAWLAPGPEAAAPPGRVRRYAEGSGVIRR